VAFVGSVGEGDAASLTALRDTVNVASRLASAAGPGELLVSRAAAQSANLDVAGKELRELELKGKSEPVAVVVLGAGT
jgi:adenylate cyclase